MDTITVGQASDSDVEIIEDDVQTVKDRTVKKIGDPDMEKKKSRMKKAYLETQKDNTKRSKNDTKTEKENTEREANVDVGENDADGGEYVVHTEEDDAEREENDTDMEEDNADNRQNDFEIQEGDCREENDDTEENDAHIGFLDIFINEFGSSIKFSMYDDPERARITSLIERHGGQMRGTRADFDTIHLSCNDRRVICLYPTFSTQFVKDCVRIGTLTDLSNYRLDRTPPISERDVMCVLMGHKTWSDVMAVHPFGMSCSSQREKSPPPSDSSSEGESNSIQLRASSRNAKKKYHVKRHEYSNRDRIAIVRHILDNDLTEEVSGRKMWEEMANAEVCPGQRSWQSLKEHFRRQILPHFLESMEIPLADKLKLLAKYPSIKARIKARSSNERKRDTEKRNRCPAVPTNAPTIQAISTVAQSPGPSYQTRINITPSTSAPSTVLSSSAHSVVPSTSVEEHSRHSAVIPSTSNSSSSFRFKRVHDKITISTPVSIEKQITVTEKPANSFPDTIRLILPKSAAKTPDSFVQGDPKISNQSLNSSQRSAPSFISQETVRTGQVDSQPNVVSPTRHETVIEEYSSPPTSLGNMHARSTHISPSKVPPPPKAPSQSFENTLVDTPDFFTAVDSARHRTEESDILLENPQAPGLQNPDIPSKRNFSLLSRVDCVSSKDFAEEAGRGRAPRDSIGSVLDSSQPEKSLRVETDVLEPANDCEVHPSSQRAEPSSQRAEPSSQRAEPSSQRAEPSSQRAEPSSQRAEPSSQRAEPSSQRAEPSSQRAEPSSQRAEPSSPPALPSLPLTSLPHSSFQASQSSDIANSESAVSESLCEALYLLNSSFDGVETMSDEERNTESHIINPSQNPRFECLDDVVPETPSNSPPHQRQEETQSSSTKNPIHCGPAKEAGDVDLCCVIVKVEERAFSSDDEVVDLTGREIPDSPIQVLGSLGTPRVVARDGLLGRRNIGEEAIKISAKSVASDKATDRGTSNTEQNQSFSMRNSQVGHLEGRSSNPLDWPSLDATFLSQQPNSLPQDSLPPDSLPLSTTSHQECLPSQRNDSESRGKPDTGITRSSSTEGNQQDVGTVNTENAEGAETRGENRKRPCDIISSTNAVPLSRAGNIVPCANRDSSDLFSDTTSDTEIYSSSESTKASPPKRRRLNDSNPATENRNSFSSSCRTKSDRRVEISEAQGSSPLVVSEPTEPDLSDECQRMSTSQVRQNLDTFRESLNKPSTSNDPTSLAGPSTVTKIARPVVRPRCNDAPASRSRTLSDSSDSSFDMPLSPKVKPTGRQWRKFTRTEDLLILEFILENRRHKEVGAKNMWEDMVKTVAALSHRSWHSVKERYRKIIVKNLGQYYLTESQKALLTGKHCPASSARNACLEHDENKKKPSLALQQNRHGLEDHDAGRDSSSDSDSSERTRNEDAIRKSRAVNRGDNEDTGTASREHKAPRRRVNVEIGSDDQTNFSYFTRSSSRATREHPVFMRDIGSQVAKRKVTLHSSPTKVLTPSGRPDDQTRLLKSGFLPRLKQRHTRTDPGEEMEVTSSSTVQKSKPLLQRGKKFLRPT